MSGVNVNNGVVNYGGTPSIGGNTAVNRPAANVRGRLFIDTTNNLLQYDTGSAWVTIGSGGGGITGSGVAGQATFWSGTTSVSGDNAFFWDNTNKRLGLGTITPGVRLDIHGTGVLQQLNGTTTNNAYLDFQNAGSTQWRIGNFYNGALNIFSLFNAAGATNVFSVLQNGNVGIGPVTPSAKLNLYDGTNPLSIKILRTSIPVYVSDVQVATFTAAASFSHNIENISNGSLTWSSIQNTSYSASAIFLNSDTSTSYISFLTASAANTAPTEKVRITGGGFMGINYTAPAVALAVSGSIYQGLNVANSNFQMLCNQNFYTVGFSPNFSTYTAATVNISVSSNLGTGYVFKTTATITVNLPAATGLNNQLYFVVLTGTTVTVNRAGSDVIINNVGTSVTSLTLVGHTKTLLYCDGGTIWYQLF